MARNINTRDINKLLKLFRQLLKSITSEPPQKNNALWEQCLEQSKKEYINELKEFESHLSPPRNVPRKASREEEINFEKAFQRNTTKNAEKKYRQVDMKYDNAILKTEKKKAELIKRIDHLQYSIRDQLVEFDRAQGTLLATDWQKIMEILPPDEIVQPNFQFYIEKSIEALEAIKCKVKNQQPNKSQKIGNCMWKFYEMTIEAFFKALLNKSN